jgi:hypothetical protein
MSSDTTTIQHPAPASGDRVGRGIGIGFTSLLGLFGVLLTLGGAALIGVHAFARDSDGFYSTDTEQLASNGYAVTTADVDLNGIDDLAATMRINATSGTGDPLFIGIASRADAERYLAGADHSVVTDYEDGAASYEQVSGSSRPARPAAQGIWVASSQGTGEQRVEWKADSGHWIAVAMNADASRGVDVDVDAGAKVSWLIWVGIGLAAIGLAITGLAAFVIRKLARG